MSDSSGSETHEQNVVVLAGGSSHEREVSLWSGQRVVDALTGSRHQPALFDLDSHTLVRLREAAPCIVVNALHGPRGEDGVVAEVLDALGLPYVGSAPGAARLAYDKVAAKAVATQSGIATPASLSFPRQSFEELGAHALLDLAAATLGLPIVVKPVRGGSSLGLTLVTERGDLPAAVQRALAFGNDVLLERHIQGVEVAVSIVNSISGPRALPAVEVELESKRMDYAARYTADQVVMHVPPRLSEDVIALCQAEAMRIHEALGLSGLTRTDFIVDSDGNPWFLEVSTSPGLTATSILPTAVEAAGTTMAAVLTDAIEACLPRAG